MTFDLLKHLTQVYSREIRISFAIRKYENGEILNKSLTAHTNDLEMTNYIIIDVEEGYKSLVIIQSNN